MDAEKFLKDSNLSSIADGDTLGLKVVYEDDVIYLMEKYHQSKVNNGVLDDVIVSGKDCKIPMREFGSDKCLICGKQFKDH